VGYRGSDETLGENLRGVERRRVPVHPIQTAEDAIQRAESFLGRYYAFRRLLAVRKEDIGWLLEFDVGLITKEVVRITLDASTGTVIEYVTPGHS
jgi:hypothetical protein